MSYFDALNKAHDKQRAVAREQERALKKVQRALNVAICELIDTDFDSDQIAYDASELEIERAYQMTL